MYGVQNDNPLATVPRKSLTPFLCDLTPYLPSTSRAGLRTHRLGIRTWSQRFSLFFSAFAAGFFPSGFMATASFGFQNSGSPAAHSFEG